MFAKKPSSTVQQEEARGRGRGRLLPAQQPAGGGTAGGGAGREEGEEGGGRREAALPDGHSKWDAIFFLFFFFKLSVERNKKLTKFLHRSSGGSFLRARVVGWAFFSPPVPLLHLYTCNYCRSVTWTPSCPGWTPVSRSSPGC